MTRRIEQTCLRTGAKVAARAEMLAGITADEIRTDWQTRLEAAVQWGPENTLAALAIELGCDKATMAAKRRMADCYLAALAEIRPMGGELKLHHTSDATAVAAIAEGTAFFPAAWIETSNAHRPLVATLTPGRAGYRDLFPIKEAPTETLTHHEGDPAPESIADPFRDWKLSGRTTPVPVVGGTVERPVYESLIYQLAHPAMERTKDGSPWGKGWEKWTDPTTGQTLWRRPASSMYGSQISVGDMRPAEMEGLGPHAAAAVHELAHRFDHSVKGVARLASKYRLMRTNTVPVRGRPGEFRQQPLKSITRHSREKYREGGFVHRYMGRVYVDAPEVTEVLSMGMEALFCGTFGGLLGVGGWIADLESRDMVLGILASAGTGVPAAPAVQSRAWVPTGW